MSRSKPHENPLVPHKKMQQMFTRMTEMRTLSEYILQFQSGSSAGPRMQSIVGEEACRVSMTIDLVEGDLICDTQPGLAMGLIAGAKIRTLIHVISENRAAGRKRTIAEIRGIAERILPWIENQDTRWKTALGVGMSFSTLQRQNILVLFTHRASLKEKSCQKSLALAVRFELPIIFVVLPEKISGKTTSKKHSSLVPNALRIPRIPVDASDSVALYRVAQESVGRTRNNGGPVLVECLSPLIQKQEGRFSSDPVIRMRDLLLSRRICTKAWLDTAGSTLAKKLHSTAVPQIRL